MYHVVFATMQDIHSPRVPGEQELKDRLKDFIEAGINPDRLVVNPGMLYREREVVHLLMSSSCADCGLKTRGWSETEAALKNMVAAAKWARETYGSK